MEILKLIGIIFLSIVALFCLKRIVFILFNLRALNQYRKNPDPINERHGMVFNKKTNKLEADQSIILHYE